MLASNPATYLENLLASMTKAALLGMAEEAYASGSTRGQLPCDRQMIKVA